MMGMISGQVLRAVTERVLSKVAEQLPRLLAEYGAGAGDIEGSGLELAAARAERNQLRARLQELDARCQKLTNQTSALEKRLQKRDVWLWGLAAVSAVLVVAVVLLALLVLLG
jgi:chromosome segregation ATPase